MAMLGILSSLCSCQEDYDLDIPDGWDTNTTPDSDVDVDTLAGIDVSMYHQARIFPGLVDTLTERHIEASIHLDLSKPFVTRREYGFANKYVTGGAAETLPQPIYSTGLYAGAGELVKIVIPDTDVYGLTVQVGIHTDDLSNVASYFREPIAYTRKTLHPGTNYVRFPLGGYIWIVRELNAIGAKDVSLDFSGVYAAPDYIKGVTDPEEWQQKVMSTTVPWLELRGDHIIISIDLQRVKNMLVQDPEFAAGLDNLLNRWDKYMELFWESRGIYADAENNSDRMPFFPERIVFDAQLVDNKALHFDNVQAIMMLKTSQLYDELTSLEAMKATSFLSFNNTMRSKYSLQSNSSKWDAAMGMMAAYRNAEYNYATGDFPTIADLGTELTEELPVAYSFAAADSAKIMSNARLDEKSISTTNIRLAMLAQLGKYDILNDRKEYSSLNAIFQDFRKNHTVSFDESWMFRAVCDRYGVNMTPFFENWGVELNDADREYAASKYELPSRQIWRINTLDKHNMFSNAGKFDASSFRYRHCRDEWEAYATDKTYKNNNEDTEYDKDEYSHKVDLLFDGLKGTYWASYLGKKDNKLGGQPSKYELPYYIVIDMKDVKNIDGIYFANGTRRYVSKFKVQMTSSAQIDIDDPDVAWTDVIALDQTFASPLNEQFVNLPQRINTRYLRIVITEENLNSTVIDTWKEEDQEKAKKLNSLRYQQFAEFGTFYYKK